MQRACTGAGDSDGDNNGKELAMKFIMTFAWKPDPKTRAEGIARFRKTGGQPPKGARLLGRWTRADISGGFDLLESDDPQALAEFALQWSDLMELSIVPVLEDEALSEVLKRVAK
jgi:hypothetical protein